MPHAEALKIIAAGKGTHFDPMLAEVFLGIEEQIRGIAEKFSDETIAG
jgi:putative two-component system response regulator